MNLLILEMVAWKMVQGCCSREKNLLKRELRTVFIFRCCSNNLHFQEPNGSDEHRQIQVPPDKSMMLDQMTGISSLL
ncbi:unnamed protein product [Victoria cruziana]